jgi:hypothetical protein
VTFPVPASEEEVVATCELAIGLAPLEWLADLPSPERVAGSLGLRQWHAFERDTWPIGEAIRRAFVQFPKLKKRTALIGKVVEVATHRNLRRGRQSFLMAMGFVYASQYAATLVPFLRDSDVDGQIVHTLLKMRASGYARVVATLLGSKEAWKLLLARKYIERYPTE